LESCLVNWTNGKIRGLKVTVQLPAAPKTVRTVSGQKALPSTFDKGKLTFTTDLDEADYLLLSK
jgi:hypothetical protein